MEPRLTMAATRPRVTALRWSMRFLAIALPIAFIALVWWAVVELRGWRDGPAPETIVAASLKGVQEQNVLVPFTARYVAVVTSKQERLGLAAQKTLIMPGTVRYELDLASLREDDLDWQPDTATLTVTLPPLRLAGPDIDIDGIREYRDGEVLMLLTNAEDRLDDANRAAAQTELLAQARGPVPLRLARTAAIRAVEQSFAMPLRAAGLDAKVTARFAN
jgi:hypothetical protein